MRELLTPYIQGRTGTDNRMGGDKIADVSITWEDPDHIVSKEGTFTLSQMMLHYGMDTKDLLYIFLLTKIL